MQPADNCISFYTRRGKLRTRYSPHDRLKICGATQGDLDSFIELFCPGRPIFAQTRAGTDDPRDWITARGKLKPELVLKHLVGNLLPGLKPTWIAPRSDAVTKWCCIDVDFRGDMESFRNRCKRVLKLLKLAGIHRNMILVSVTPSKGRHYRFFFDRKVRVWQLELILSRIDLCESAGQIEIFPKTSKGLRLPFGFIPDTIHDPNAWVRFIRRYRRRKWPLVNWGKFLATTENISIPPELLTSTSTSASASASRSSVCTVFTNERVPPQSLPLNQAKISSVPLSFRIQKYLDLLARPFKNKAEASELERMGICVRGTRTQCTRRLAWHYLCVLRLTNQEAIRRLTEWVYRTGAQTSDDVQRDLRNGTRHVEKQISDCVEWISARKADRPKSGGVQNGITQTELIGIRSCLGVRLNSRLDFLRVAMRILLFAKQFGTQVSSGWEVALGINGIVRSWPECAGRNNYKPYMDELVKCGFITLVKEKIQTANKTGRSRVYRVNLISSGTQELAYGFDEASQIMCEEIRRNFRVGVEPIQNQDTYTLIYQHPSKNLRFIPMESALTNESHDNACIASFDRDSTSSDRNPTNLKKLEDGIAELIRHHESQSLGAMSRAWKYRTASSSRSTAIKAEPISENFSSSLFRKPRYEFNRNAGSISQRALDKSRSTRASVLPTPRARSPVQHAVHAIPSATSNRGEGPPGGTS